MDIEREIGKSGERQREEDISFSWESLGDEVMESTAHK
jgi:hypothetical protein